MSEFKCPPQWDQTPDERDRACKGEICPNCKSTNVKYVGSNPDGININAAYDCNDCGTQWEGY